MTNGEQSRSADFKNQARNEFDNWADSYDGSLLNLFLFRPSYLVMMEEVAKWRVGHPDPFRLLDVGSGTGTFARLLAQTDWPASVVGLDYSPRMGHESAEKASKLTDARRPNFVTGDSEHLPFADDSFDVLTCANSFHHYPRQSAVVKEMKRVLRPRGRLILLDGFRDNAVGWFVFDVIVTRVETAVYHAPWHEIDDAFRSAGFGHIRRRKFNLLFPVLATMGDA